MICGVSLNSTASKFRKESPRNVGPAHSKPPLSRAASIECMSGIPEEKLERLTERWMAVQHELSSPLDQAAFRRLSQEFAKLDPVVATIRELQDMRAVIAGLKEMIAEGGDKEMVELARDELSEMEPQLEEVDHKLKIQLLPKDDADDRSVILEVRAGTGGDEAALFAADLFRMYQRYAEARRWTVEIVDVSENDLGGYREIVAAIRGEGVFARLKYESGVHRVQRVPATEASGRIHTSAATVAVLPEPEDVDIDIRPEDIRIDTMRASGAGGQHVNTTEFSSSDHTHSNGYHRGFGGEIAAPESASRHGRAEIQNL